MKYFTTLLMTFVKIKWQFFRLLIGNIKKIFIGKKQFFNRKLNLTVYTRVINMNRAEYVYYIYMCGFQYISKLSYLVTTFISFIKAAMLVYYVRNPKMYIWHKTSSNTFIQKWCLHLHEAKGMMDFLVLLIKFKNKTFHIF